MCVPAVVSMTQVKCGLYRTKEREVTAVTKEREREGKKVMRPQ